MGGTLVISSQRILFHAYSITNTANDDNYKENDLSIDSSLICIHALQEQDEDDNGEGAEVQGQDTKCIYLQLLTTTTTESNDEVPIEILFIPQGKQDNNDKLQTLFQAFSKTAELNPPLDDDDGDDNGDTEMFCSNNKNGFTNWDDLLIEPDDENVNNIQNYDNDVADGQFDDAEDDD